MAKLKKIVIGILILFLGVFLVLFFLAKRAVPQYKGEFKLNGKLQHPVSVIFDRHGIPHITAQNGNDFYFSFGYLMASERLFQMDIHRRLASGRLSELFGEKLLELDEYYANFFLYETGAKILENLPEELAHTLDTFYEGVNYFIENGATPLEYYLLGTKPKPFDKRDGMSFVGHMALSFSLGMRQDPLFFKLKQLLPENLYRELLTQPPKKLMAGINNMGDLKISHIAGKHLESLLHFGFFEGSNAWLLDGTRTRSNKPILANDPHIAFSNPGVWYEAHYKIVNGNTDNKDDTHEMYGHFLPLIPIPVLGHNRQFGWGLTMSYVDDLDLYKEKIDFEKEQYFDNGEWKPLEIIEREFLVRGLAAQTKKYYKTKRGPIFANLLKENDSDTPLSLNWAHYKDSNRPLTAFWHMNHAKNIKEFHEAISVAQAPGLNVLYADTEGNIAHFLFGENKLRADSNPSYEVLDSQNPEHFEAVSLPINLRANMINPTGGQIVSANQRPPLATDDLIGDWHSDDRYVTIERALLKDKSQRWDAKDSMELQTRGHNIKHQFTVKKIDDSLKNLSGTLYADIRKALNEWDGLSKTESVAPTFIHTWIQYLGHKILRNHLSEEDYKEYVWLNAYPIFIERILKEEDNPWWGGKYSEILKQITIETVDVLKKKLGSDVSKWHWGRVHTFTLTHPLGNFPVLSAIFNLGDYEAPGAFNDINNMRQVGPSDMGDFPVKAGPSTRRIIDFSTPQKAHGILPSGNSGHLLSPFYKDQLAMFLKGEYRPMLMDLDEIKEHWFYSELVFK